MTLRQVYSEPCRTAHGLRKKGIYLYMMIDNPTPSSQPNISIPTIDVSSQEYKKKLELANAMADLSIKEKEIKKSSGYGKAYFWSLVLPPLGVYYFIKYVFFNGGEKEGVRAGVISLVLTLASILLSFILFAVILNQVASVIPGGDVQMLKELTSPEKQKELLQLYR